MKIKIIGKREGFFMMRILVFWLIFKRLKLRIITKNLNNH